LYTKFELYYQGFWIKEEEEDRKKRVNSNVNIGGKEKANTLIDRSHGIAVFSLLRFTLIKFLLLQSSSEIHNIYLTRSYM
jgi:hypothetical protein